MSASLTISSASVASDGKTVTVNIGGSSGAITPSSGVTGFRVRAGSNTLTQATATISGTVLTIVLAAFAGSGQTVQIDTIAGNLADGSGNTMVLANNQAVTNSATKTATFFAITDSHVVWTGSKSFYPANNGRDSWDPAPSGLCTLDICFTGTDLALVGFAYGGGGALVKVDGGAETTIVPTTTGSTALTSWSELALASGLAEGTHRIELTAINGGMVMSSVDGPNGLKVAGAAPALLTPNATNTAIKPIGDIGVLNSASCGINSTAFIKPDDNWSLSSETYGLVLGTATQSFRFTAQCTEVRVLAKCSGPWALDVDGVAHVQKYTPGPTDFKNRWVVVATGLDGTAAHDYRLTSLQSGNVTFAVMAVGGTGFSRTAVRANQTIGWYGDSITNGFGCTDASYAHSYLSPLSAGKDTSIQGVPGSYVVGASSPSGASAARIAGLLAIPTLERVVVLYGTNDIEAYYNSGGTPNATYSPANFYTAYRSMLDGVTAAGSNNIRVDCWGILIPGHGGPQDALATSSFNPQILAAVNDWKSTYPAKAANVRYIDTSNFGTGGLHPTDAESVAIANHWTPFIATPGYTITGPTSGTVGSPSSAFTVATNGGLFNGTEVITLSDGGQGGTFTPSVGSPGTGSVAVTPANNTSSFTFTYRPASTGAKTLAATNNATLLDPSSAAFTGLSAVVAYAMFFAA